MIWDVNFAFPREVMFVCLIVVVVIAATDARKGRIVALELSLLSVPK